MAGNLSNRSSGVQIPRDICTRFGRYLYSTKWSWKINLFSVDFKIIILLDFWTGLEGGGGLQTSRLAQVLQL